jgi:hypothetical protein
MNRRPAVGACGANRTDASLRAANTGEAKEGEMIDRGEICEAVSWGS